MGRVLAAMLLLMACSVSAEDFNFDAGDGWYRWNVPAAGLGDHSCCYRLRGDRAFVTGCNLDPGMREPDTAVDCVFDSTRVQVYARLRNRQITDVRALTAGCPVRTSEPVHELGAVDASLSVRWLATLVGSRDLADDNVLAAIAMHAGRESTATLIGFVEDRGARQRLRKKALFWLVQSDADDAYRYLDTILSRR